MIYTVLIYNIGYFRIGKKNTPPRRCLRKRKKPIPESFGIAAQAIKKTGKIRRTHRPRKKPSVQTDYSARPRGMTRAGG